MTPDWCGPAVATQVPPPLATVLVQYCRLTHRYRCTPHANPPRHVFERLQSHSCATCRGPARYEPRAHMDIDGRSSPLHSINGTHYLRHNGPVLIMAQLPTHLLLTNVRPFLTWHDQRHSRIAGVPGMSTATPRAWVRTWCRRAWTRWLQPIPRRRHVMHGMHRGRGRGREREAAILLF